jgi:hypothetical protein
MDEPIAIVIPSDVLLAARNVMNQYSVAVTKGYCVPPIVGECMKVAQWVAALERTLREGK